jgi:glyceraldehyde 3-phosphate dehydrogenase
MKVIINGAGRIGRCIIRQLSEVSKFKITNINDPFLTAENLAYLLKFDSVYGQFKKNLSVKNNQIIIGNNKINFSRDKNFISKTSSSHILIDASGIKFNHDQIYKSRKNSKFKSIITHTFEKADLQHIYGVNDKEYNRKKHNIISTSICDAIAIGPVLNLIQKNLNLISGSILTLHPWLGYQNLVDGPSRSFAYPGEVIENFSLGRASTEALISKKTSCVSALSNVLPGIEKKISSMSVRVPTQIVSSAFLNLHLKGKVKLSDIKKLINKSVLTQKNKIIYINKDQCISKDFISNPFSTIVDDRWTEIKNSNLRLLLWYDNEYGYTSRIIDFLKKM